MAFVSERRVSSRISTKSSSISSLQMVGIDRKQRPLGLDVPERPDEVYRSKRIDSRYAALWVFIH